jgi:hypothetical protein
MNESALPSAAKEKLEALHHAGVEAGDAAASANRRLNSLSADQDRKRLEAARSLHQAKHDTLNRIVMRCRQWLTTLPAGTVLESATSVNAKAAEGLTLLETIEQTRAAIVAAENHLRTIRGATAPKAELNAQAAALVQSMRARGWPKVFAEPFSVAWSDPRQDFIVTRDELARYLAWLDPAAMTKRLEEEIDALRVENPIASEQKAARTAELTARIADLEIQEECLIVAAASQGVEVLRRPTASPAAVLGVVIKQKAEAKAA